MACSTDPTNAPESADCAVCRHKTGAHYMRQNGSFGCRHCGGNSEHRPEHHIHTYNIAGVCTTCGRDADALATDHHFCENDDSPTRGATMVLDMIASIVTSDRTDADVGLMVRRVLNEPTLAAIRKASTPAAPQPETCVTCSHTLTGVPFCTAAGCLCPEHRGPTLTGAEEWRSVALELATEVKRLNERPAPQPETEMCALCPHEKHSGMMCLVLAAGETCQCRSERMPTEEEIADLRRRYAPQTEPEGMTDVAPKFSNVGNGHCLYCNDVGNLHRRRDQPDGHLVCYDCSRAYRLGWTAAKGGR